MPDANNNVTLKERMAYLVNLWGGVTPTAEELGITTEEVSEILSKNSRSMSTLGEDILVARMGLRHTVYPGKFLVDPVLWKNQSEETWDDLEVIGTTPKENGCARCDTCGGEKTYRNQAILPINGRTVCVDWCIHHIVAALNAANVRTVASCCGHGEKDGNIRLEDGRELVIKRWRED